MFVAQGTPQAVESVRTVIVLFAVISVLFWKPLLKIAVAIAAIAIVVLLASGAILILQSIHHAN